MLYYRLSPSALLRLQKERLHGMSAESTARAAPFLTDSFIFDWKSQSFRADLIFVLPVAVCLGLGMWLAHPGAGLIAAGGAFTVGFGAKQHIDESRVLPMILASLGIGATTFIGMVAGHTSFILVLIAAGAGFIYGMLSMRQPGVSWVGQQSIVFLLVASAFPFSPRAAAVRSALVMAGGALQILTSSILLQLLQQLRTDLLSVARYLRAEHQALRSSCLLYTSSWVAHLRAQEAYVIGAPVIVGRNQQRSSQPGEESARRLKRAGREAEGQAGVEVQQPGENHCQHRAHHPYPEQRGESYYALYIAIQQRRGDRAAEHCHQRPRPKQNGQR